MEILNLGLLANCGAGVFLQLSLNGKHLERGLQNNIYLDSTQIVSSLLAVYISCDILWNLVYEKGTVSSHQQDTQAGAEIGDPNILSPPGPSAWQGQQIVSGSPPPPASARVAA